MSTGNCVSSRTLNEECHKMHVTCESVKNCCAVDYLFIIKILTYISFLYLNLPKKLKTVDQ